MRVLFINDTILHIGGAENYMFSLKKLLEQNGHEVLIIGSNTGVSLVDSFFSRWFSFKYFNKVTESIVDFKPEIVHIHGISRVVSPSVLVAAKRKKVSIVQTVHDYHFICPKLWMINDTGKEIKSHDSQLTCLLHHLPKKNIVYALFKHIKTTFHNIFIQKYIDHFICASDDLTERYSKKFGKERVTKLPYFVNEDIFSYSPLKIDNSLLFSGRLSREKGIDLLLEAFNKLSAKYPRLSLTIVGDGPQKNTIKRNITELGLHEKVILVGKASESEMAKYYKLSSLVVIPSIWLETGPLVAYEAIHSGRPVLGSNAGGIKSIIKNGKTGILFERNNLDDLVTKLDIIFSNPKVLSEISNEQRNFAKIISQKEYIRNLQTIYQKLFSHNI